MQSAVVGGERIDTDARFFGSKAGVLMPPENKNEALTPLLVGGGRRLPRLLFVTRPDALARSINDPVQAAIVLKALRAAGTLLELPPNPANSDAADAAVAAVRAKLTQGSFAGVVLVGGYDVVPSMRVDVLSSSSRVARKKEDPTDRFTVWNDDAYTNLELPVSRVPDGHSAALLRASLGADRHAQPTPRFGVRNARRAYADTLYNSLSGSTRMKKCAPRCIGAREAKGDLVYLLLHGEPSNVREFFGEAEDKDETFRPVGFSVKSVPSTCGAVVFSGCCWGALTVTSPAGDVNDGDALEIRTEDESVALTFLRKGAIAFIGCTALHFSPEEAPHNYFGQPMHEAFFSEYLAGRPPAQALFEAKKRYAAGIPHGRHGARNVAIEQKTLAEFTCLGLGW